jgi:hypothetical protein
MARQSLRVAPRSRVHFSNGTILACGFPAIATHWTDGGKDLRAERLPAEEDLSPGFRGALAELGIEERETIHLDAVGSSAPRRPRVAAAEDTIVLRPAGGGSRVAQVVLYQDESGGLSWHFADGWLEARRAARAEGRAAHDGLRASAGATVFTIRSRTAAARAALRGAPPPAHLRGPITKWGRKVFKVLGIPLLAPLLEEPLERIVERAERRHRQDLVRPLSAENYRVRLTTPYDGWASLDGRRALLVIHGILSSTEGMLAQFPRAAMEELHARYEGRLLAYDQLTVSKSPEENARFFLEQAQRALPGGRLSFDILCHSRGGIVARTLAERAQQILPGGGCTFPRVFFVATPNRGSLLADPGHVVDMIDVFTNLLTSVPDGPVSYSIEIVLAIVKLLAHAAETALPGLAAMGTGAGTYVQRVLNTSVFPAPAAYAAAAADYEPDPKATNGFFLGHFADALVDRIFVEKGRAIDNDLVVPTNGVFDGNGHPSFPIADPLVFGPRDRVWHTGFFGRRETLERIWRHFGLVVGVEVGRGRDAARTGTAAEAMEPPTLREPPRVRRGRRRARPPGPTPAPGPRKRPPVPPTPPVALARQPFVDFPDVVAEGEATVLRVRLDEIAAEARIDVDSLISVELTWRSEVVLRVTLSAPGFDVAPAAEARMTLKAERDAAAEQASFTLVARFPGVQPKTREIRADFWLGTSCLGAASHRTVVTPKNHTGVSRGSGPSRTSLLSIPSERREGCDLAIHVEGQDETGEPPLRMRLTSTIIGNEYAGKYAGELKLPRGATDLGAYLDGVLQKQLEQRPRPRDFAGVKEFADGYELWERRFNLTLDGLGRRLWTFLPAGFRQEYHRLLRSGRPPRSILVHSDEMVLPWELVVPHEGGRTSAPLGRAHVLGRWRPGLGMKPQPQTLPVQRFCVLSPAYDPPLRWAEKEAIDLKSLFPKLSIIRPATHATVVARVLERSDVQILHFSGHGEYDASNADLSALLLEDGTTLDAIVLTGSKLALGQPIVYLNACSVGNVGRVVGRPGGFAAALLDGGVSGVVAPYWPIDDRQAMEFCLAFYRKLLAGRAVGEALQELRAESPRDSTVRAFSYFGDPWARANFTGVG